MYLLFKLFWILKNISKNIKNITKQFLLKFLKIIFLYYIFKEIITRNEKKNCEDKAYGAMCSIVIVAMILMKKKY